MSVGVAARIARREMRGGIRGFRVFLICLALGIAAIAAIGSVRQGVQNGLESEGAVVLGGDAEIRLTYRYANATETEWMAGFAESVSEIVEFRSMAVTVGTQPDQRALTQVKAVDDLYPLYGSLVLEPNMDLETALKGSTEFPGAVMDRVLVERLGLNTGSTFRLGTQTFVLGAVLESEPDNAGGFSLGPRSLVRTADLATSGLLAEGTLFETAYRMKTKTGADLSLVREDAEQTFAEGGFRWRDRRNAAPGVAEFVDRLGTFLVLVGLAGLIVGGVGVSSAVRAFLDEKTSVIAILKSYGAERRVIFLIYLIQIATMSLLGIALGLIIGAGIPFAIAPLLGRNLPIPAVVGIYPLPLVQAAIYGLLVAVLFSLWPISRTARTKVGKLFRNAGFDTHGWPGWRVAMISVIVLITLVATAALFSGHVKIVLWAAFGLAGAFVVLQAAAVLIKFLARILARQSLVRRRVALHLAMVSVAGPGREVTSVVLSLGLGLSVLASVGQIDANLQGAISQQLPQKAPAFFVLDIQQDQIETYMERLNRDAQVSQVQNAPMLRGLITHINGKPAKEIAGDHWVIRGDRGLTYSEKPPSRGEVTEGHWWPENYAGDPQISFAAVEAAEIGLSLGDTLTVNVLGRPVTATITSFRNVDFSDAGMGFVIVMNPGALAGAPHSFISTIYAEMQAEPSILRDLSQKLPNITLVNVRQAIERVGGVLRAVAGAITYGTLATLVTGLVVIVGAAAVGQRSRDYEAAILKTLGATRPVILGSFLLRWLFLGLAAGTIAVLVGILAGWSVITLLMELDYKIAEVSAVTVVGIGVLIAGIASTGFSFKSINSPAAAVLRTLD